MSVLFLALASAFCARQHRVLAVFDNIDDGKKYSQFFEDLKSLGCDVTFTQCSSEVLQLERFGERKFDTIVILCSRATCFGHAAEDLTSFLDKGGNAFVFTSKTNDIQDKLWRHFNLRVAATQRVSDILGNDEVVLRRVVAPAPIVSKEIAPLVYEGGFGTIDRPNDFRIPIVTGSLEHNIGGSEKLVANTVIAMDIVPIYALQGRTSGRVVFVHSDSFASDEFYSRKVTIGEDMQPLAKPIANGNRALMKELSEYVTHYKSHVHILSANHYDALTKETPVQYRWKQNITVVAELEVVENGEWKPYQGDDVQVEVFMLGVFVRRHMKRVAPGKYEETLMLPDRSGNFKIKVFTNKDGWMNAREEMAIAIRPLAIREKEKFLVCAQPYQFSMMLVMAAAFLASVHFLYHKPSD